MGCVAAYVVASKGAFGPAAPPAPRLSVCHSIDTVSTSCAAPGVGRVQHERRWHTLAIECIEKPKPGALRPARPGQKVVALPRRHAEHTAAPRLSRCSSTSNSAPSMSICYHGQARDCYVAPSSGSGGWAVLSEGGGARGKRRRDRHALITHTHTHTDTHKHTHTRTHALPHLEEDLVFAAEPRAQPAG